jgi:hypothetical protein
MPEVLIFFAESKSSELILNVQGGNYQEYFAKKMADLKARGKHLNFDPTANPTIENSPR